MLRRGTENTCPRFPWLYKQFQTQMHKKRICSPHPTGTKAKETGLHGDMRFHKLKMESKSRNQNQHASLATLHQWQIVRPMPWLSFCFFQRERKHCNILKSDQIKTNDWRCSVGDQCQVKDMEKIVAQHVCMEPWDLHPCISSGNLFYELRHAYLSTSVLCTGAKSRIEQVRTGNPWCMTCPANPFRNPRICNMVALVHVLLVASVEDRNRPETTCYRFSMPLLPPR